MVPFAKSGHSSKLRVAQYKKRHNACSVIGPSIGWWRTGVDTALKDFWGLSGNVECEMAVRRHKEFLLVSCDNGIEMMSKNLVICKKYL